MDILCDCHLHTISSGHAYSTITEYAQEASNKGLELIAMTDHGPTMPGASHLFHFYNMRILPEFLHGVRLLKGAEVNILDADGALDLDDEARSGLDLVVASIHVPCFSGASGEATKAMIAAMGKKKVHIIGHPDDGRFPLCYDELARAAASTGTMLEVNNSSLMPTSWRQNAAENYKVMLEAAERHGALVVLNSDAHFHTDVGNCSKSLPLVLSCGFPAEFVANTSAEKLIQHLGAKA